jgi:hypothetical protein
MSASRQSARNIVSIFYNRSAAAIEGTQHFVLVHAKGFFGTTSWCSNRTWIRTGCNKRYPPDRNDPIRSLTFASGKHHPLVYHGGAYQGSEHANASFGSSSVLSEGHHNDKSPHNARGLSPHNAAKACFLQKLAACCRGSGRRPALK